jgi:hypothetical protein
MAPSTERGAAGRASKGILSIFRGREKAQEHMREHAVMGKFCGMERERISKKREDSSLSTPRGS